MHFTSLIALFMLLLCSSNPIIEQTAPRSPEFNQYWFTGLAEISSYELSQARYGENHKGTSVIVMVTEPFSKKKQVKLDQPTAAGNDAVTVLKMNRQRSFITGIYPYRVMTSVFTPVGFTQISHSLKTTHTVQEWCGQTFSQFNHKGSGKYESRLFSYFESEGDQTHNFNTDVLEDELFTLMRINPELLPQGAIKVVPSQTYNRFIHKRAQSYEASGQIQALENGLMQYTLQYNDLPRKLSIQYSSEFPHTIEGWQEEYKGLTTYSPTQRTTAKLVNRTRTDYWNKNHPRDTILYQDLMNSGTSTH